MEGTLRVMISGLQHGEIIHPPTTLKEHHGRHFLCLWRHVAGLSKQERLMSIPLHISLVCFRWKDVFGNVPFVAVLEGTTARSAAYSVGVPMSGPRPSPDDTC